jgi:2-hydroxy-6-oxonona-2,4-dienedioate hydrolase
LRKQKNHCKKNCIEQSLEGELELVEILHKMQERYETLQYAHQTRELKIRYLESGYDNVPKQKHVLFIHGLGSSAERWLDIPDALSLYFHTVAIDMPGFGKSDKPSDLDYSVETLSYIVRAFIDKIGIADSNRDRNDRNRTTLVGHSLGGYVAAKIAADVENRYFLDKLILVDSSGNLEKPTQLLEQYLDAAMNPSIEKVRKVFEQMVANPLFITDALVNGFINRINNMNAKYAFEASLRNSANTQIGIKELKEIGENGIPTLILWGMEDKVIPMEHSQIFKKAIKDSDVVIIPATGHAPFSEKPALVCEYLHRFLSK